VLTLRPASRGFKSHQWIRTLASVERERQPVSVSFGGELNGGLGEDAGVPSLIPQAMATGSLRRKSHPSVPVGTVALLRPWQPSDAGAVVEAFTDPEIQRWHVRRADSVDEARQWITSWRAGWGKETQLNWALVDRSTGSLMGRVSLKSVDLHDGSAGVAYWMVPAWRGHGLCSQAVIALCQWAFKEAGFHRIGLDHSVLNGASCRVAVKAGFYAEGICKGAALHADGWHDMHRHALLAAPAGAAQPV